MSEKYEWLVQIPINADDLDAWASNRDAHIAHLKPYAGDGTIVLGGPTIEAHPKGPNDGMKITSSVLMLRANTEEEVRTIVGANPFVNAGVWDMGRALVTPVQCTVRKPA